MAIDKTEKISAVYNVLLERLGDRLKIITYPSDDYKGYSYLKIYNKNSGKQHMTEILCREYKIEKSVTIETSNGGEKNSARCLNKIMRSLKNEFEPLVFKLPNFKASPHRKSTAGNSRADNNKNS